MAIDSHHLRKVRVKSDSRFQLVLPVMASAMYTLSLAHWTTYMHFYIREEELDNNYVGVEQSALLALLSLNVRVNILNRKRQARHSYYCQ